MPKACPKEFRKDVVAVAQCREAGVTIKETDRGGFRDLRELFAELTAQSPDRR